jgi:proteasome accessory factor B
MNRTERLLDLITYLLNSRDPVSWQEIKNHFPEDYDRGVEESNQRKFERDKAELVSLGIPIDYQPGSETKKEGYIIEKEKLFLPEVKFTSPECSLLLLAASAVLESDTFPYHEQLEAALRKIVHEDSSPAPGLEIRYSGPQKSHPTSIQEIQEALERRKTVRFSYFAFSTGKTSNRQVNPYGLVFRRGQWTLVGWDHTRKDVRSFVLSRISGEVTVNQKRPGTPDYKIPADFSLERYRNQQPWELEVHEPLWATIQVTRHRLPELLPDLSNAVALEEGEFQLRVTNKGGLVSWVLSQRTDVRVLSPVEVQSQICEALEGLL